MLLFTSNRVSIMRNTEYNDVVMIYCTYQGKTLAIW